MWKRKELKQKAKQVVKKNYWTSVVVCFLVALITGEFGTSIIGIWQSDDSVDPNFILKNNKIIAYLDSSNQNYTIEDIFKKENLKETKTETEQKIIETIEANLNSATKSQKYIFRIWDAIKLFDIEKNGLGIKIIISAVIAIIFTVFIADPLIVGGKKYFINSRKNSKTRISILVEVFKKEHWLNIAIIMFLRNIFNALWYITIIGGIIKTYEYRMIPYILAENPKIKRKEAFKLTKQMMKGNKWNTFVLDMSFFGWNFLSVLTSGILGILYVNPYSSATNAELYMELRKTAKKNKYEYYELLNDKNL